MHSSQLVTILGICLSYARAFPSIDLRLHESIEPIVTLVTTPHDVLGTSGIVKLSSEEKVALQESPVLYAHQLAAAHSEALNSLLYLRTEHKTELDFTDSITQSIVDYSHAIVQELPEKSRKAQFEISRDALYSRLYDLAKTLGSDWPAHAAVAKANLEIELNQLILAFAKKHIAPAGENEIISHLEGIIKKIKLDPKHEKFVQNLATIKEHVKTHLPSAFDFKDMSYLTKEEVESALEKAKQPGLKDASTVKSLALDESVNEKSSATATHTNSARPAQLPPSPPKMVATAA